MKVTVRYFARLREAVRSDGETIDLPGEITTVGGLRDWLIARGTPWAEAFTEIKHIRAAVAQEMATDETTLSDGAEVALFPPVTGG